LQLFRLVYNTDALTCLNRMQWPGREMRVYWGMAAPRPIWKGHVSFGLVNIPVTLYSAERRNDISLHLLDERNSGRVRYQRINEDTGEEVPWNHIVKGYEYDGGQYVLLDEKEMD